ncbi:MAG: hypothetical protein ACYC7L_16680 [Nitrospirota bacterium]
MDQPSAADAAQGLRQLLIDSSAMIEEYTREVCPSCTDVCCRQKHGAYRERDVRYLNAIGAPVPSSDRTRAPESRCEFLGANGCIHPRWLRPFKCTWYFCEPIIVAMQDRPQRSTRALTAVMEEMIRLYDALGG